MSHLHGGWKERPGIDVLSAWWLAGLVHISFSIPTNVPNIQTYIYT